MSNKDEFQEYLEKYGQSYLDQLELERTHKEEAEHFLQRSFEKALQENDAYSTSMGRKLIDYTWESCRKNIRALMEAESKPKRGVKALYSPLLHQLVTLYGDTEKGKQELENLLTLASLTEALNACLNGSNKTDISRIAYAIAVHVEEEANIATYLMQHPEKTREMSVKLNQRIRYSYRRMFALTWLKIDGWTLIQWKKEQRIHLGAKLLDTIIAGSGFFTLSKVSRKGASITCLQPSEWLVQTWEKNREIALSFAHRFTPTIIPPKPWDNPYNGGYYGDHQQFTSLVRLQNGMDTKLIRDYQKRLNQVDLSCIYKALNALQATPFCINKQMLTVCQQIKNHCQNPTHRQNWKSTRRSKSKSSSATIPSWARSSAPFPFLPKPTATKTMRKSISHGTWTIAADAIPCPPHFPHKGTTWRNPCCLSRSQRPAKAKKTKTGSCCTAQTLQAKTNSPLQNA